MQDALLEVSKAPIDQPPNIQVKHWARDVKELSYDVEDTIDAFMVRIGTRAPKKLHGISGFINRSLNLLTKAHVRHKIGTNIKDIKRRITEVSERRDRYKVGIVDAKPVGPTIDSLRLSALYKKATELVGMEDMSNDLIKRLMEMSTSVCQSLLGICVPKSSRPSYLRYKVFSAGRLSGSTGRLLFSLLVLDTSCLPPSLPSPVSYLLILSLTGPWLVELIELVLLFVVWLACWPAAMGLRR